MNQGTAHAIAIGRDHVAIAGTTRSNQTSITYRTYQGYPTDLVMSVSRLLTAAEVEVRGGEGVLVVDRIPGVEQSVSAYLEAVRAAGWVANDAALKHGSTWVTVAKGPTTIHTFVGQASVDKDRECVLAKSGDSATTIAMQMAAFQHVLGTAWRINGGATCHAFIRQQFSKCLPHRRNEKPKKRPQPRWHWKPYNVVLPASPIVWKAVTSRVENCKRTFPYVHHLDVRAQYLAGMSMANLGWDPPVDWGSCEFDPKVDGYWKIRIMEKPKDPFRPDFIPRTRIVNHRATVTTPLLAYMARDPKFRFEVEDSLRFEKAGRYLRPIAETIRNARIVAAQKYPRVLDALKETYTHGIGLFAAEGGSIERRDWRDCIVDTVNTGLARKIDKIPASSRLLEVCHDSLWIASDDPNPEDLMKIMCGGNIGNLRYEETLGIDDYLEKRK